MPRKKSSPAEGEVFRNLLRTKWPMAPDTPSVIKSAGEQIDAAMRRFASLDRELAALQRRSRRGSKKLGYLALKELRKETALARERRDAACRDLVDLLELAEMPVECMGWA